MLADLGDGNQDVDQAADEDHGHGLLPLEAQAEADGVDEEGVQTHAGGLRQGQVGQQTDEHRAHDGGDGGGNVDGAVGDGSQGGEHAGVDHQNVGHGHEGGQTCDDLRADVGASLRKAEEAFHK